MDWAKKQCGRTLVTPPSDKEKENKKEKEEKKNSTYDPSYVELHQTVMINHYP
jgi:hypothetical protein